MFGCEGAAVKTRVERVGSSSYPKTEITHLCAVCLAVEERISKMSSSEHQAFLRDVQDQNGVENYRYQKSAIVNGRPVLVRGAR